jgi:MinD-like ATPase involved in chromosome partitioning or flagellar assembly
MDYLAETGSVGAKSQFVLNHIFAREVLKLRDIESSLGAKVAIELPYDPFIYLKAVNEGVPVVVGAPRSAAADRFGRLARIAFGGDAEAAPAAEERRGGLLGGLLRRT